MDKPRHAPTATTVLRLAEARRNEDQVLAESSLAGERRVAVARLAMIALFAFSEEIVARTLGRPPKLDAIRMAVVAGYVSMAIVNLIILRRIKPTARGALIYPFPASLVDFGFMVIMGWREFATGGRIWPEMGAIAFAVLLAFSVARSPLHVAFSTLLACAAYLGLGAGTHVLTPISSPFVVGGFLVLGLVIGLTNHSVRSMFSGLRRRDNLSRFLPRAIVDRVLDGGEEALAPVQREVTVLFSDLRDFTRFSESLAPRDVLEFLDDYFGHMSEVVKGHDGVVNKFLGDGMLAFWGVPDEHGEHARAALKAALDMRARLSELNERRAKAGLDPVRFGVGIHTGTVAAGMLGGADQHEYTVIGDAVNVASRIEGLTKSLGVDILVSESAWRAAGAQFVGERRAEEKVKGRADPVVVYALDGVKAR